ncbi:MAG: CopD family protein [Thermoanaerobaculia bacterium]|nr:CopD family protein [Thermoanaerobaculia bacterium]
MEVANWYSVSKAMHLIGMVSWMAGLFYLVRLMVYHAEARVLPDPQREILTRQYNLMEWKVYKIILKPAVVITWVFGVLMLILQPIWLQQAWMYGKLVFVLLLTGYTYYCKVHIRHLESNTSAFTHVHYRVMNEVPTIILVSAVFLAVFRTRINWWYLLGGVGAFTLLIIGAVRRVARKA